jgi:ubiquinone/menaquinone biosynthesis C-methylase UbiE
MRAEHKPLGAGHGTFDLIDRESFFEELRLGKSTVLLDIGCGRGDYTIALAELIGPEGRVYALDAWREGLAQVRKRASIRGLKNIETVRADVNKRIPLEDGTIDVCLMATVLHDLLREGTGEVALRETARVLKPGARLAIVEFKKVEVGPGPPQQVRLSEEETEAVVTPYGFKKEQVSELGAYHYLFVASMPR